MTRTVNDRFDRLIEFQRGKLSDANTDGTPDTVTTAARTQGWTLDALGNWSTISTNGTLANRTHNSQNQITSGGLGYDANGNLNAAGDADYKYDGWNRLVSYDDAPLQLGEFVYKYDALGRRIVEVFSGFATTNVSNRHAYIQRPDRTNDATLRAPLRVISCPS